MAAATAAEPRVERVHFKDHEPLWTFSGAWSYDENSFYLVDILQQSIDQYALDGALIQQMTPESLNIDQFEPTFIEQLGGLGQYLVESGNGHFYWFDQDFNVVRQLVAPGRSDCAGNKLLGTTTWTATRDFILAFGDVETAGGDVFASFVQIPVDRPQTFALVGEQAGLDSPARQRHYVGYSFSAPFPAQEGAFVLLEDDALAIRPVAPEQAPIALRLAADFEMRSPWASWNQETRSVKRFEDLEQAAVVTHVAVAAEHFYLLRRDKLVWTLERLVRGPEAEDRRELRSVGAWTLPTRAQHLILIPGRDRLLFVEKGPVIGIGDQRVWSFFTIRPSEWPR